MIRWLWRRWQWSRRKHYRAGVYYLITERLRHGGTTIHMTLYPMDVRGLVYVYAGLTQEDVDFILASQTLSELGQSMLTVRDKLIVSRPEDENCE